MNAKTFLYAGFLLAAVSGCTITDGTTTAQVTPLVEDPCPVQMSAELPTVNLPLEGRCKNWGGGSCYHASLISVMRWQGLDDVADWWRQTYSGGESTGPLAAKCEKKGLRYAWTDKKDVAFLEWCCRTRRGAAIPYGASHAQTLVHLDSERAGVLNNNTTSKIDWFTREEFLSRWHGDAVTVVYCPAPPLAFVPPKK